ncbi:ABC transporter permease [Flavobacterium sp. 7A]|uniref:ABC transporter permease n=1 Tax=Flavobacterium sp. 7A TaxID=2940571 RepID=UPI002225F1C5|nr:ABC transporter permease subunit [Flavobacterium sp. 7A]MCW2119333.1 NitT/TauT family transport system permease protein [Flavobacterium sp. 7A]
MITSNKNAIKWKDSFLSILLFLVVLLLYQFFSHQRHLINPADKLLPTFSQIIDAFNRSTFIPDRSGTYRLWEDSVASGRRIYISLIFIFAGILFGVYMGSFKILDKLFYKFFLFFDKIPALAILPILFIVFGLGEVSKIALIVIGVVPTIILDTYLKVKAFPQEQLVKAITMGSSKTQTIFKIILPKIFPMALDSVRLNFKAVILFLISGEALAATEGLGYRIFVVRRYMAMDSIISYVIWIGILSLLVDVAICFWLKKSYSWYNK